MTNIHKTPAWPPGSGSSALLQAVAVIAAARSSPGRHGVPAGVPT
ncbi:hypothetical protein ACWCPM_17435 [Streptomyces sp. NPDC002309]